MAFRDTATFNRLIKAGFATSFDERAEMLYLNHNIAMTIILSSDLQNVKGAQIDI